MKIFISETIELPIELSYLLTLIAKEITPHVKMFLPERKLIGAIKKDNILKKLKLSEIEIFENVAVKKSRLELKTNRFKANTLILTLGEDFYEMILNFQNTIPIYKSGITSTRMMPYDYVLRILKILFRAQFAVLFNNMYKKRETDDENEPEEIL